MSARNTKKTPHWEQISFGWEWSHPLYGVVTRTRAEHKFKFDYWAIPDEMNRAEKIGPLMGINECKAKLRALYEAKLEKGLADAPNP
jgi:hypothetical protein